MYNSDSVCLPMYNGDALDTWMLLPLGDNVLMWRWSRHGAYKLLKVDIMSQTNYPYRYCPTYPLDASMWNNFDEYIKYIYLKKAGWKAGIVKLQCQPDLIRLLDPNGEGKVTWSVSDDTLWAKFSKVKLQRKVTWSVSDDTLWAKFSKVKLQSVSDQQVTKLKSSGVFGVVNKARNATKDVATPLQHFMKVKEMNAMHPKNSGEQFNNAGDPPVLPPVQAQCTSVKSTPNEIEKYRNDFWEKLLQLEAEGVTEELPYVTELHIKEPEEVVKRRISKMKEQENVPDEKSTPNAIEKYRKDFWEKLLQLEAEGVTEELPYVTELHVEEPEEVVKRRISKMKEQENVPDEKDRYKVDLSVMHGNRLPLLLTSLKGRTWFPGITSPFYFLGARGTAFAMHCEDMDLVSINLSLGGYPKIWYGIPMEHLAQYEAVLKLHLGAGACDVPARHKHFLFAEGFLHKYGIKPVVAVQDPWEMIVTFPKGHHGGFNTGFNWNVAVNFAPEFWVHYGIAAVNCSCETEVNIRFSMEPFVRHLRPSMYKDWLFGKMTQTPDEWTQRRDLRACGLSNKHVKTPTLSDLNLTKIPRTKAAWALAEDVSPTEVHLLHLLQERIKFLDGKVTDLLGRGQNKPDTVSCDLLDVIQEEAENRIIRRLQGATLKVKRKSKKRRRQSEESTEIEEINLTELRRECVNIVKVEQDNEPRTEDDIDTEVVSVDSMEGIVEEETVLNGISSESVQDVPASEPHEDVHRLFKIGREASKEKDLRESVPVRNVMDGEERKGKKKLKSEISDKCKSAKGNDIPGCSNDFSQSDDVAIKTRAVTNSRMNLRSKGMKRKRVMSDTDTLEGSDDSDANAKEINILKDKINTSTL
ncbi:unnamed protein product, partial [Notodromas monacha]